MRRLIACLVIVAILCCSCFAARWCSDKGVHVSKIILLSAEMYIQNDTRMNVAIPYYIGRAKEKRLSILSVRAEVNVNGKWKKAKLNPKEFYGDAPPKEFAVMRPGEIVRMVLEMPYNMFILVKGQRVRLLVEVWPEDKNTGKNEDRLWLTTTEFRMP